MRFMVGRFLQRPPPAPESPSHPETRRGSGGRRILAPADSPGLRRAQTLVRPLDRQREAAMAKGAVAERRPGGGSRLAPDALAAALHEAATHRVEGRHDEAYALYEQLERNHPEVAEPAYFLALIDLLRGRPAPALARLLKLTRRLPRSFDVWQAVAHAYRELGRWREAIEASRRALAIQPNNVQEQLELAEALEVTGAIDQALDLLGGMADQAASRLPALMRIARLKPAAISEAQFEELAQAAASNDRPAESQAGLQFNLAEILERRGQFDEAFAAFAAGARIKHDLLSGHFEPTERPLFAPAIRALSPDQAEAEHIHQVAAMKAIFTPGFIAQHQGGGHHLETPIFIVGMPRSGSTLLEQILSSHPKVQGLGETGGLVQTVRRRFPINLSAPNPAGHFRKLAEDYLAAMHDYGWTSAPRFIDKLLDNYLYIGVIHLMFPRARILHSVRDPVETCLANFRILFQTGHETSYDLAEIGRQYVRYREMMAHWDEVLPGRVIEVRHEALVADPEAQIRWLVTEACGLAWDEACLSFHKTKRAVRTASVAQVRQPIFSTAIDRWRRYEAHLGPLFEALGPYAPKRP
jgi:tetratricopeptide (TPR) repeat protein